MSPLGQEPVPAAGAGGELGTPALGRLGQCLGPRAAERAQCVLSVSHPGWRAAGAAAGGASIPRKGGEMNIISVEWRQKALRKEGGWGRGI